MLPRLIFITDNFDPAPIQQITRMLPLLKSQGYAQYFDDLPSTFSLKDAREYFEKSVNYCNELYTLIDKYNANDFSVKLTKDVGSLSDEDLEYNMIQLTLYYFASGSIYTYRKLLGEFSNNALYKSKILENSIIFLNCLVHHVTNHASLNLIKRLEEENIEFACIGPTYKYVDTLKHILDNVASGPVAIESGLMSFSAPSFGCIGPQPVSEVVKILSRQFSQEEISNRFCFIDLYSKEPLDKKCENSKHRQELRLDEYEEARSIEAITKVSWIPPENYISINCTEMTSDDIDRSILSIIQEKKEGYALLLPTLREDAQTQLVSHAAKLEREMNSHPKHGIWALTMHKAYSNELSATKKLIEYFSNPDVNAALPAFTKSECKSLSNKQLGKLIDHLVLKLLLPVKDQLIKQVEQSPRREAKIMPSQSK